ncbi:MAG: hypothetical protein V4534_07180 [Myxococcota bacterium]
MSHYLTVVATFILSLGSACKLCDRPTHDEAVQCLSSMHARDISQLVGQQKIYISLSTSPKRLGRILPALRTLDLTHVEKIYLALPKLYRNQEAYGEIPQTLKDFPKLEIIAQDQDDLGPIMKMLPAVELVGKLDQNALVIAVDDDIGFPGGAINELIYYAILHPNAVISGWGNYAETFGILPSEWPSQGKATKAPFCGSRELSYCDTVEGWRGIVYRPRLVNTKRLREVAQLSKACRTSDDLVVSHVLAESGIEKIRVVNHFYPDIHRFEASEDDGALHKINLNIPGWSPRPSIDAKFSGTTNSERYQRCVLDIRLQVK